MSSWNVEYQMLRPIDTPESLIASVRFGKLATLLNRLTFRIRVYRYVSCTGCGATVNEPDRMKAMR